MRDGSLLGLATWPHHVPPSLQDTLAIKKQKRCRKIRPVSAFISESSSLRANGTDSVSFIFSRHNLCRLKYMSLISLSDPNKFIFMTVKH